MSLNKTEKIIFHMILVTINVNITTSGDFERFSIECTVLGFRLTTISH